MKISRPSISGSIHTVSVPLRTSHKSTRRRFLGTAAACGAGIGIQEFGFLTKLPPVSAADAKLDANLVRVDNGIDPLVRLLEQTPRDQLLEAVAGKVRSGTSYREVLAALLLLAVAVWAVALLCGVGAADGRAAEEVETEGGTADAEARHQRDAEVDEVRHEKRHQRIAILIRCVDFVYFCQLALLRRIHRRHRGRRGRGCICGCLLKNVHILAQTQAS